MYPLRTRLGAAICLKKVRPYCYLVFSYLREREERVTYQCKAPGQEGGQEQGDNVEYDEEDLECSTRLEVPSQEIESIAGSIGGGHDVGVIGLE